MWYFGTASENISHKLFLLVTSEVWNDLSLCCTNTFQKNITQSGPYVLIALKLGPNSVAVKCKQTYSLGIVNHVLAPYKNGDRTARHIVLLPSEDHRPIFPRVVVGEEREA